MARLARFTQKIFGSSAGTNQISQFGSLAAGSPVFTTAVNTIQALSNYAVGWFGGVVGGNSPAIEDMNSLFYMITSQLAYIFQLGIPEYDASTTYYIGSFVTDGAGIIYRSLTNSNIGNTPVSSPGSWGGFSAVTLTTTGAVSSGSLAVAGSATVGTTLSVTGSVGLSSSLAITGPTSVGSTLAVASGVSGLTLQTTGGPAFKMQRFTGTISSSATLTLTVSGTVLGAIGITTVGGTGGGRQVIVGDLTGANTEVNWVSTGTAGSVAISNPTGASNLYDVTVFFV